MTEVSAAGGGRAEIISLSTHAAKLTQDWLSIAAGYARVHLIGGTGVG